MDLGLAGRSGLLVGAGRGLGGAAAVALAREKAKVAVVARTAEAVEAKAAECRKAGAEKALGIAADATDPASLKSAIETTVAEFGGLDALVTLVGGSQPGGTAELTGGDWETAYERNLWPAVRASRYALPNLIASAARRGFSVAVPAMQEPQVARDASVVLQGRRWRPVAEFLDAEDETREDLHDALLRVLRAGQAPARSEEGPLRGDRRRRRRRGAPQVDAANRPPDRAADFHR